MIVLGYFKYNCIRSENETLIYSLTKINIMLQSCVDLTEYYTKEMTQNCMQKPAKVNLSFFSSS